MKSLNETELTSFLSWLEPQVLGAQVQDIWSDGDGLILDCYRQGSLQLYIDLRPNLPFLTVWTGRDVRKRKPKPRPLALFLQSHAKNALVSKLSMVEGQGRVAELQLSRPESVSTLRLILIPQAPNISANAEGKSVHWAKPKELRTAVQDEPREFPVAWSNWSEYLSAYKDYRWASLKPKSEAVMSSAGTATVVDPRLKNWRKDLEKKADLIEKLNGFLSSKDDEEWQNFGEVLKLRSTPEAGEEKLWDARLSLSANRERAFRKAKDLRAKRDGTRERIEILKSAILELESWLANPSAAPIKIEKKGRGTQIMNKSASRGRTLNLPSGLQAVLGRSAKDNLAILRQARAWDYWIHLKDEPSAHAILFREKNQKVSMDDLELVSQWILRAGSGQKLALEGVKYDVVVVECRFVRPIKGDKLGRVNYQSPQVYTFASRRS